MMRVRVGAPVRWRGILELATRYSRKRNMLIVASAIRAGVLRCRLFGSGDKVFVEVFKATPRKLRSVAKRKMTK